MSLPLRLFSHSLRILVENALDKPLDSVVQIILSPFRSHPWARGWGAFAALCLILALMAFGLVLSVAAAATVSHFLARFKRLVVRDLNIGKVLNREISGIEKGFWDQNLSSSIAQTYEKKD